MRTLIAAATFALTAACSSGSAPGEGAGESATGFITPGASVPETAERDENGVPRDDYGRPYDYMYLGREIPAFDGTMEAGPLFSTRELENQWTIIDVWGIWCGDCMRDAPYVAELWEEVKGMEDLSFLSIHTPPNAKRVDEAYGRYGSVEAYFEEKGYNYPTLVDEDASIRETLAIEWTPSYLLVAPDLTVQGFRSDLSAVEADDPVAAFLEDIAEVRASYDTDAPRPVED
ncbi:TlpA disulfide reductase family protein [Henriciella sp.]|uniref:TlpA family protein disulfide reductase n=1 Tax=Henriciella sp. TaxID=1968823 RepID=UPI0026372031|nr:TlpA disulfide reductase family protein [Henriciella sp.]